MKWQQTIKWVVGGTLLLLLLAPRSVRAQTATDNEARLVIPPNPDGPTEVFVGIGLRNITGINEREETFEVDGELYAAWHDPRLSFDPQQFGADEKVYQGEVALEKLKSAIWWPDLEIVDSRGPRERMYVALSVLADGSVFYRERFQALIYQPFFLGAFPFDEHEITFTVEPFSHAADRVTFVTLEEEGVGLGWESDEWAVEEKGLLIDPGTVDDEGATYAAATLAIEIRRDPSFYLSNFVLPLLLIVAISWAVFWMDFETMHLADRMSVSFTSVLTVVAFDFVTADSLPKLPYATLLDNILSISYLFLGLTVLENLLANNLAKNGRLVAAGRIDKLSRLFFPVVYYFVLALAFAWALIVRSLVF